MVGMSALAATEGPAKRGLGELVHDDASQGSLAAEVLLSFGKIPVPLAVIVLTILNAPMADKDNLLLGSVRALWKRAEGHDRAIRSMRRGVMECGTGLSIVEPSKSAEGR